MKHLITLLSFYFFIILSANYAQLTVKDQAVTPNTLIEVNDEGTAGSITLPSIGSFLTGPKLYNNGGDLYWDKYQLGTVGTAGGWTDAGSTVRLTNSADKVGIGTGSVVPSAKLHVIGNDGVLFQGTFGSGTALSLGSGVRFMWYPKKAAIRAGDSDGTNWDDANIGDYSAAFGRGTKASGESSFSAGKWNSATGIYSSAIGEENTAAGQGSFSTGLWNSATGTYSTAIGQENIASGYSSAAIGYEAEATAGRAIAIGSDARASGMRSVALGEETRAIGNSSTAIGTWAQASNQYSRSFGYSTTAAGDYSTAMGTYVNITGNGSFIIGDNSTTSTLTKTFSNRFYARFANGYFLYTNSTATAGVYVSTGGSSWSSVSDSTKKENFNPVIGEDVLSKISKFKLGTWNYIGQDPVKFRHYGPMAQDFFAAFGHDGIGTIGCDTLLASADFDGVNFIAIQALEKRTREQQSKITELENKINILENMLRELAINENYNVKYSRK